MISKSITARPGFMPRFGASDKATPSAVANFHGVYDRPLYPGEEEQLAERLKTLAQVRHKVKITNRLSNLALGASLVMAVAINPILAVAGAVAKLGGVSYESKLLKRQAKLPDEHRLEVEINSIARKLYHAHDPLYQHRGQDIEQA